MVDPSGHSAVLIGLIIGAIVGVGIGFGTVAYIDYQDNGQIFNGSVKWYEYVGGMVTGAAEIISGTVGLQFGDAISIGVKGYVGIGFTIDFTNGIKFGVGLGLGYEISLNIDWYELFH